MKIRNIIWVVAGLILVTGACTPMIMVGKEGRGGFLGNNSKEMYEMLCTSGDLEKVLEATQLSKEMKDEFYLYNCSAERSSDKVKQLYASMTTEQRREIRNAFKQKGYSINAGSCCGPASGKM